MIIPAADLPRDCLWGSGVLPVWEGISHVSGGSGGGLDPAGAETWPLKSWIL